MICVATVLFFLQTLAAALALSSQKDGIDRKVGIRKREESSSSDETEVTMGYIWDYETTVDGTTETFCRLNPGCIVSTRSGHTLRSMIGTPFTHTASPFSYTTTLDNYYFWRPYVISYSTSTASDRTDEFVPMTVSPDGPGPDTMWTACSNGTITGTYSWDSSGNTSSSCAYGGWDCFTYIIQSRFDDTTDRLTSLECRTSYSTDSSETIIYREEPAKSKHALPFRPLSLVLLSSHRSSPADMNDNSRTHNHHQRRPHHHHPRRPHQYPPFQLRQSWVLPNEHPFPNFLSK